MKYFIWAGITLIATSGLFLLVLPTVMYQRLINEGSVLADNQCLKVNPIIIERKNSYIKSMKAIKGNDIDGYFKETDNYYAIAKRFVDAQTSWLNAQKVYMGRWDFQYFVPDYMKDAAVLQYTSRNADMESTKLLIESYGVMKIDKSLSQELGQKSVEKIKLRNEAEKKYGEIFENPGKIDWRTRFIKVPASKCPDKNFDIPDVDDFLNPGAPINTNSPLS